MDNKSVNAGIAFGIINLILVVVCCFTRVFLISTALILLLIIGVSLSVSEIKESETTGEKVKGMLGLLINGLAALVYAGVFVLRIAGMIDLI